MEQVWNDLDHIGVSPEVKLFCQQIFKVIDDSGELGIRRGDLKVGNVKPISMF